MTRLSILLAGALAMGAGILAMAPGARAGGDLDYDYRPHHRSESEPSDYHGGDERGYGDRCHSGVRAVGKGWPVESIARRSAIRAWERETRYVHGTSYAYWENARHQDVECRYINGVSKRCEARGNPCRL
jgi:hypothetical protein